MPVLGADTSALRELVRALRAAAAELESTGARITTALRNGPWWGPDRDRFAAVWHADLRALRSAADALRTAAATAGRQADEQEAASGPGGGAPPETTATGRPAPVDARPVAPRPVTEPLPHTVQRWEGRAGVAAGVDAAGVAHLEVADLPGPTSLVTVGIEGRLGAELAVAGAHELHLGDASVGAGAAARGGAGLAALHERHWEVADHGALGFGAARAAELGVDVLGATVPGGRVVDAAVDWLRSVIGDPPPVPDSSTTLVGVAVGGGALAAAGVLGAQGGTTSDVRVGARSGPQGTVGILTARGAGAARLSTGVLESMGVPTDVAGAAEVRVEVHPGDGHLRIVRFDIEQHDGAEVALQRIEVAVDRRRAGAALDRATAGLSTGDPARALAELRGVGHSVVAVSVDAAEGPRTTSSAGGQAAVGAGPKLALLLDGIHTRDDLRRPSQ